jgi:hypothetical protein
MKFISDLTKDDMRSIEIITNKVACAEQFVRPDAVPSGLPSAVAKSFFKEAVFSLADARFLRDYFWLDIAKRHNVSADDLPRLHMDFEAKKLCLL